MTSNTQKGDTMYRSNLLLVLLAFAFGLWLGFNPEAHAATLHTWQDFKASVTKLANQTSTDKTHQNTPNTPLIPNTGKNPKSNNITDQLSKALNDLWVAVKNLWNDLMKQLSKKTT
jgi:hypothetical protein